MQTRAEIQAKLTELLVDMFEVDAAAVTPTAQLYDDLDIDSIDAVDLVVKLKEVTGKKIQPEEFKSVRTVEDVVIAIEKLLQS
ncbi:MAG: acyl carrier protein [Spongiibacteraceae bacterium]